MDTHDFTLIDLYRSPGSAPAVDGFSGCKGHGRVVGIAESGPVASNVRALKGMALRQGA